MVSANIPGNRLCWLDGEATADPSPFPEPMNHVSSTRAAAAAEGPRSTRIVLPPASETRPSIGSGRSHDVEGRWLAWGRSAFAVLVVLVLIALGIANMQMRARWHEVE